MDILDLVLASVGDKVEGENLCGEQRCPRVAHFGIGAGSLAAVERLHGSLQTYIQSQLF